MWQNKVELLILTIINKIAVTQAAQPTTKWLLCSCHVAIISICSRAKPLYKYWYVIDGVACVKWLQVLLYPELPNKNKTKKKMCYREVQ